MDWINKYINDSLVNNEQVAKEVADILTQRSNTQRDNIKRTNYRVEFWINDRLEMSIWAMLSASLSPEPNLLLNESINRKRVIINCYPAIEDRIIRKQIIAILDRSFAEHIIDKPRQDVETLVGDIIRRCQNRL